jgi:hypothetical protein
MKLNIAIPSYKRSETLRDKTLSVLEKYNVDPNVVTIFVANNEEKLKYEESLNNSIYNKNIVVGVVGMGPIRNFIRNYYNEGDFVVNFDDDLSSIMRKSPTDEKKMEPIEDIHKEVFDPMYNLMIENENKLCGVYAASNAFFMSYTAKTGLYYCIGSLWGCINDKHPDRMVQLCDKEDFERTLQHYVLDGSVSRLDNITVISKYYTEDGGMQVERTLERIDKSADDLVKRFPDLCTKYIRETTGHAELRLRDTSNGKYKKQNCFGLDEFF